jgi:hypothetical protein
VPFPREEAFSLRHEFGPKMAKQKGQEKEGAEAVVKAEEAAPSK